MLEDEYEGLYDLTLGKIFSNEVYTLKPIVVVAVQSNVDVYGLAHNVSVFQLLVSRKLERARTLQITFALGLEEIALNFDDGHRGVLNKLSRANPASVVGAAELLVNIEEYVVVKVPVIASAVSRLHDQVDIRPV